MPQEQIQPREENKYYEDNNEVILAKYGVIKMSLANDLGIGFGEWDAKYKEAFKAYAEKDMLLLDDYAELGTREDALKRVKNAIYH